MNNNRSRILSGALVCGLSMWVAFFRALLDMMTWSSFFLFSFSILVVLVILLVIFRDPDEDD